jgi:recombination protein RecT
MTATVEQRTEHANGAGSQKSGAMILLDDLQSDDTTRKLLQILPSHMKPEFFVRVVINQLNKNSKLALCTRQSFIGSVLDLAAIGLEPDGRRAHLIPYGRTCTYQLDYKGIAELVLRSGKVSHVAADVIRRGDIFVWNKGQLKEHVPHFLRTDAKAPKEAGEVFAAYSLVVFKDGTERAEVMSRADILAIRDGSPGWQAFVSKKTSDTPWDPRFPHKEFEMWKKTVFKRLSKWLPISAEAQAAIEKEDHNDYGDRNSNVINSPGVRTVRSADDLKEELKRRNAEVAGAEVIYEAEIVAPEGVSKESLLLELKAANDPLTIIEIERDLDKVRDGDRDEVLAAIAAAKARL